MKNLIFTATPQRVWRHYGVLRPTKNSSHVDFLGGDIGNWNVFRYVAVVRDIRFEGQALAEVLRRWLEYAIAASITSNDEKRDKHDADTANISQMVHTNWMLEAHETLGIAVYAVDLRDGHTMPLSSTRVTCLPNYSVSL